MLFELKIRHAFEESFHSMENLFAFLREERVVFKLYTKIEPHQFPGQMTYLGVVEYVGLGFKYEKALYVTNFTEAELKTVEGVLKAIQQELAEKWKHIST